jgi:TatA/E family protein of Tat protein translocase
VQLGPFAFFEINGELADVKSIWGLLILLFVVLLLFGNRLPAAARALGQSLIEFKRGLKEGDDESAPKHSDRDS